MRQKAPTYIVTGAIPDDLRCNLQKPAGSGFVVGTVMDIKDDTHMYVYVDYLPGKTVFELLVEADKIPKIGVGVILTSKEGEGYIAATILSSYDTV